MEKQIQREGGVLATLSVLLIAVFLCSITLYDRMETETAQGTLSVFAADVRDFLTENEAVSAFLGVSAQSASASESTDDGKEARVAMAAAQYIDHYNEIYRAYP